MVEPGEVRDLADADEHEVGGQFQRRLIGPPHDDALEALLALETDHFAVADDLDAGLGEAVLRVREGAELVAPAHHRHLGDLAQRERRVQSRVAAPDDDGALGAYLLERRQPVRESLAEEALLILEAEAARGEAAQAQCQHQRLRVVLTQRPVDLEAALAGRDVLDRTPLPEFGAELLGLLRKAQRELP